VLTPVYICSDSNISSKSSKKVPQDLSSATAKKKDELGKIMQANAATSQDPAAAFQLPAKVYVYTAVGVLVAVLALLFQYWVIAKH
jgi:hypothetical protein